MKPRRLIPLFGLALACSKVEATRVERRTDWPAPANDPTPLCADLSDARVCWPAVPSSGGTAGISVNRRPIPPFEPSPLGFRCAGNGAARRCVDRGRDAPRFVADGPRFVQRHPRLPDDGEWECTDMAGAAVCRGGGPAAGAPRSPKPDDAGAPSTSGDPGFFCGPRRVRGAPTGERVCVDFSPDFPARTARGARCGYEPKPALERVCEHDPTAHALGDACDREHPCIDGAHCVSSRCAPERPDPSCWLDADCAAGSCRFGTCSRGEP